MVIWFIILIVVVFSVIMLWLFGEFCADDNNTGSITAKEALNKAKQERENIKLTYSECCKLIDREIKVSAGLMYTQCRYWVPDYLVDKVKEHYEGLGYAVKEVGWLDKKYLPDPIYDKKYKLIFDWGDAE